MSSPKLERVKQQHPGIAPLLQRLNDYIQAQLSNGQKYVVPKLAAAALKINDGEAYVLLDLLEKGGVLRRVYNVYCRKENVLLATLDSLDALDGFSRCDFCDCAHDPQELKAELAFAPAERSLGDLAA